MGRNPHSHGIAGAPLSPPVLRRATHVQIGAWVVGLLALGAVLAVVLQRTELEEIGRIAGRVRPVWVLAAFALQGATYVCAAAVWQVALARGGYPCSTRSLVPIALAMLFTNQAFPSGGLSGSAVVLRALRRRGVPENVVMAALLTGLVTTFAAYILAVAISLALLSVYHLVNAQLLLAVSIFAVAAVALPAAVLWGAKSKAYPRARQRLARIPGLGPVLESMATAPTEELRDARLLRTTITWQFVEIVLDAATLQIMLIAIGVAVPPPAVFASFALASAVSRIGMTPLGLGTFEAASIAMLHLVGVELEAALTATLLLRACTLWLPMLPGLWCARHVL